MFEFIRETNIAMDQGRFRAGNRASAQKLLQDFDLVFDVLRPTLAEGALSDEEVEALIRERTEAKKARDFARADQIRAMLLEKGIVVEDTREGVRWRRR